jgi:membrane-associated PAP2 superfamily phosphatase
MHATPEPSQRPALLVTLLALALILAWDWGGADLAMARWFGTPHGFALRDNWLAFQVVHEGGRRLAWVLVVALTLGIWWPVGFLRRLPLGGRVQLVTGILIALAVVAVFKRTSATSCPWDLAEFGGVAHYVSHWAWGQTDGGGGHCFPAGHASAGFAFLAGYFALRRHRPDAPGVARRWLAIALAAGLLFGLSQQARGAHFMSHTLWAGWLCWTAGWLYDLALQWAARRSPAQRADGEAEALASTQA